MLTTREHLNVLKACIAQDLVQSHAILGYTRVSTPFAKASLIDSVLTRKVHWDGQYDTVLHCALVCDFRRARPGPLQMSDVFGYSPAAFSESLPDAVVVPQE
jgi:hypothetical protein